MELGKVLDLIYAFERDKVRRMGYKAFKAEPVAVKTCEMCDEGFESKVAHAKYCPPCRILKHRERSARWYAKTGADDRKARKDKE